MLLQEQQIGLSEYTQVVADSTETLRQILAARQRRDVSYDEASEVSDALIEFYEILAEEVIDEPTR